MIEDNTALTFVSPPLLRLAIESAKVMSKMLLAGSEEVQTQPTWPAILSLALIEMKKWSVLMP